MLAMVDVYERGQVAVVELVRRLITSSLFREAYTKRAAYGGVYREPQEQWWWSVCECEVAGQKV